MAAPQIAIPALVATIKAHLAKAVHSHEKSEQHYITAGLRLKELKARKPSETPWPEYVRLTFDLGRERADELIRISDGRTTVEKTRAIKAESMRKTRAKPVPRGTGSSSDDAEDAEDDSGSPSNAVLFHADAESSKRAQVIAQADRAAQTAAAKLAASNPKEAVEQTVAPKPKPDADPEPTTAKLIDAIERFGSLDVRATVARLTNDDRLTLMTYIARANVLLDRIGIEVAKAGGANLGKLAPVALRVDALKFLKAATVRIEAELAGRASPADPKPAET
jgi:hypothetical protein